MHLPQNIHLKEVQLNPFKQLTFGQHGLCFGREGRNEPSLRNESKPQKVKHMKKVSLEKFTAYFHKQWAAEGATKWSVANKLLNALFVTGLSVRVDDLPDTMEVDEYRQGLAEVSDNLEEAFELFTEYLQELQEMVLNQDYSLFS